ncbi:FtsH protease activity modulator HflK [Wohlfahrtiimonas larvae]|nr:FtsH protease activity modulator HflK [Wohlfahrtiimonas larvae]
MANIGNLFTLLSKTFLNLFKGKMKESTLEMAWNEPKDRNNSGGQEPPRDQGQKPKQEDMPDLDVLLKDLKNKVLGKSSQNNGNGHNGGDNNRTPNKPFNSGISGKLVGLGAVGAFVLWMLSGIYIVDTGTNAVVLFLGKEQAVTGPGMHWRFPSPVGEHRIINVENRFSATIGGRQETMMLTKDEAIVDVRVEVQYEINRLDPASYWFASTNPDEVLRDVVESAVRERVGQTSLDAILTSGRAQLVAEVKALAQKVLNDYNIGLNITNVNLVDAQAPRPVQAAFTDAIKAREDEQRMINQAETYVTDVLGRLNGEVERELAKAEGYKQSVIAKAEGEANRFELLNQAYAQAPSVTRQRLYLDAMETIFKDTNKVLMNTNSNNLMVLPLDQLMGGGQQTIKLDIDSTAIQERKDTKATQSIPSNGFMSKTQNLSSENTNSAPVVKIRSRQDGR